MLIPTVIDKVNNSERVYDIYSRLLKDRIIIINGEINNEVAKSNSGLKNTNPKIIKVIFKSNNSFILFINHLPFNI